MDSIFILTLKRLSGRTIEGVVRTEDEAKAWASAVPSRLDYIRTYESWQIGMVTE